MRTILSFPRCIALVVLLMLMHAAAARGHEVVTLAAGEREPYIGTALPENGYVAELAREAFRRRGYRVQIAFYPLARAKMLVGKGIVDGMLPVFHQKNGFPVGSVVYSNPFPGDTIGLLKRKSLPFSYTPQSLENRNAFLHSLSAYRIGMVRGGPMWSVFERATPLHKEMVSEDIRNLDKLALGRIQLALIDKHTAADLMASQRPQFIGQFEFMMPPLAQRDFYVAFPKTVARHNELVTAFNQGLAEMVQDGTLTAILKKHGLFPPEKKDAEKKPLVIGTVNNNDMEIMQSLAVDFERQHPNIKLEWRVLDENTLRLRLLSDLAIADGQFDVMTIGSYETPLWAKRGWLMPIHPPENYDLQDILSSVRAGLSHDGQLFALPFYAESSMTFYRKDLFARAGLTMPQKPSYDDILKFAARIHDPAAGVYGVCLRGKPGWGENMAYITTLANVYGGRWFDQNWQPELDSPAWMRAVTMYQKLLTHYGPPNPDQNGFNENLALFSQGHCGIWIDASVAAGLLFDASRSKVAAQLGYVQAPTAVTDKGAAWLWSWALAIPSSSLHKKEAMEFITWATSKDYIRQVAKRYGWIAVPPGTRQSTYANKHYLQAAPFARFVLHAIEGANLKDSTLLPKPYIGIQYVGIPEFPAIGTQVGREMAKMLRGELSPKEALTESQARLLEQMQRFGYIKGPPVEPGSDRHSLS